MEKILRIVGAGDILGTLVTVGAKVLLGKAVGTLSRAVKLPAVPLQESSAEPIKPPMLQYTSESQSPPQQYGVYSPGGKQIVVLADIASYVSIEILIVGEI